MLKRLLAPLIAVLALCAFAAPAMAGTGLHWQLLPDPAPGGSADDGTFRVPQTSLVVVGDTAYLASTDRSARLTVHRARVGDRRWQQVGGVLNHDPSQPAGRPRMAVSGGTVWIAWVELEGDAWVVRVARLSGSRFREVGDGASPPGAAVVPGNINLAVFHGKPYVAYRVNPLGEQLAVARLRSNGRGFEQVTAGLDRDAGHPLLEVVNGRLLLVTQGAGGVVRVDRLNRAGTRWELVATGPDEPSFNEDTATDGRTLYVAIDGLVYRLTSRGTLQPLPAPGFASNVHEIEVAAGVVYAASFDVPAPDATPTLDIKAFRGGAWQPVPNPPGLGEFVVDLEFAEARGRLWTAYETATTGGFTQPINVHVARLAGR